MDKRKKQKEVFIELVNLQLQPFEKTYEEKLFGFYSSESDPFFSVIARNNKSNN